MTTRRVLWVLVAVLFLAAVTVLIPGSPVYLANYFGPRRAAEGHSASYWMEDLKNPDIKVRHKAINALGSLGSGAAEAVPALAQVLTEDTDHGSRQLAALALSKMCPASAEALSALRQALQDKEPAVRMNVAQVLLQLGPKARPAIPELLKAIKDENNLTTVQMHHFTIQETAVVALDRASAGSDEAVSVLTEYLKAARTSEMKHAAIQALGAVGPEARSAVPVLRSFLQDKHLGLRERAADALEKIEGERPDTKQSDKTSDKSAKVDLSPQEREYLGNIEHHGNLLVQYGFKPLTEAIRTADKSALSRFLADDFTGTDLAKPQRVRTVAGHAEVERLQDAGHPPVSLKRDAFIARLLEFRKVFGTKAPQVKFALRNLGPKVHGKLDGDWEGTAQLRLYGEHAKDAPAEAIIELRYQLPRPTEKVLSQPGWLPSASVKQVQTARASRYLFAEVARQRGLDSSKLHDNWKADEFNPTPGGVYVCDFNRDGILDVLITDINGCALYQGRPDGTFEEVTERYGLPRNPSGRPVAAWVDIDGDGWEDLILAGRVYRNEGGKRFVDYTGKCNLRLPADAVNIVVADYDRDGKLDLYVTRIGRPGSQSWLDGKSDDPQGNFLFRNKGDWQFEDVSKASGVRGGQRSCFTAAWLDAR
jgi:HEAT repeat protein